MRALYPAKAKAKPTRSTFLRFFIALEPRAMFHGFSATIEKGSVSV